MVDLAAKRLKDKGFNMTPEVLDMAERLCIVEHVDHERFRREPRKALLEEVYALYALNELDTYRYSVSTAGAGGMVQMIAPTYAFLRRRYPTVGLNPDFVAGMRNHGNALEAMCSTSATRERFNRTRTWRSERHSLARRASDRAGYNSHPARPALTSTRRPSWRKSSRARRRYLQIIGASTDSKTDQGRAERDAGEELLTLPAGRKK